MHDLFVRVQRVLWVTPSFFGQSIIFFALLTLRFFERTGLKSVFPRGTFFRKIIEVQELKNLPQATVHPNATYAPWNADSDFVADLKIVRSRTLVDVYKLYELWTIVSQLGKLPEGDVLEVGVWRGGSGALMALNAKRLGVRSHFYLMDTFEGVVKAGVNDTFYESGEHSDTSIEFVRHFTKELGLQNVSLHKGVFPDQTGSAVSERQFRLCHIDVDTFDSARSVFDWVWPKIVPGGLVVFDDYGFYNCGGVTRLVNELSTRSDVLFFHNLNGHGIFVKLGA